MTRLTYITILALAATALAAPRRLATRSGGTYDRNGGTYDRDGVVGYSYGRHTNVPSAHEKQCAQLTASASHAASQINGGVSMVQDMTPYNALSQAAMGLVENDCGISPDITEALLEAQRRMAEEMKELPKPEPGKVDCASIDKHVANLVENYETLKAKGGDVTHVKAMLDALKEHTDAAGCDFPYPKED